MLSRGRRCAASQTIIREILIQTITETPIVFEEEDPMAFFCKTAASECQFPFIWNDVEYTTCTMEGSKFYWCAVELDTEGAMLDKRWGKCPGDRSPE